MLSWGYENTRKTSNGEYGKYGFSNGKMKSVSAYDLGGINNGYPAGVIFGSGGGHHCSYQHGNGNASNHSHIHARNCPHNAHEHQPNWSWNTQQQGDDSQPKFTIQVGDADTATSTMGGNGNMPQYQYQYYTPDSHNISETGGNNRLVYQQQNPITTTGENLEGGDSSASPVQTGNVNGLIKSNLKYGNMHKKQREPLKTGRRRIPLSVNSMTTLFPQDAKESNTNLRNRSKGPNYKLCGKCRKCKTLQTQDMVPSTVDFPLCNSDPYKPPSRRNFSNLEGKNFKVNKHNGSDNAYTPCNNIL